MNKSPIRIEEDPEHWIVRVNGQEFNGYIVGSRCDSCHSVIVYDMYYDSMFCPACNEWTEHFPNCSDDNCSFCSKKRPERPLRETDDGASAPELPFAIVQLP